MQLAVARTREGSSHDGENNARDSARRQIGGEKEMERKR